MAEYCVIHPQVKVDDNLELSELFGEIKKYTLNDYNSTVKIYYSVKEKAASLVGEKTLPLNTQGEVTLDGILSNFDVRDLLDDKFEERLKNNFKLHDTEYSVENYQRLLNLCDDLNSSIYGKNYFATLNVSKESIKPVIKYKLENDSFKEELENQKRSSDLFNKILNLFNKWGIKVDALYDAEKRVSNGVTDFSSIEKASDGFYHIIRLAKGYRAEKALPEEFGHVVFKVMEDSELMKRTLKIVKDNNLSKEILGDNYESYYNEYKGNQDLLAEEAVGKLIGIHFLQQIGINDNAIYSTILGRNINNIKNFFKKFDETEISDAINEVNENTLFILNKVSASADDVDIKKVRTGEILSQISNNNDNIDKLKHSLENILINEKKRLDIYGKSSDSRKDILKLIKKLMDFRNDGDYANGILLFLENSNKILEEALSDLAKTENYDKDIQKRCSYLRRYRNILYSYYGVTKELRRDLTRNMIFDDSSIAQTISSYLDSNIETMSKALNLYNMYATEIVLDYWEPILGDNLIIDKGWFKKNAKQYTAKELLEMNVNDISWFDLWTDSMAHSGNYLLRGIDNVVKQKHNNARLRTIEIYKKLAALTKDLEDSGIKDQNWMFQRDKKTGERTGFYIRMIDSAKYNSERDKFSGSAEEFEKIHPIENYYTDEFKSLNNKQKEYYKEVMKIKRDLDKLLPAHYRINSLSTVKIRKDLLERVKSSHSLKDATNSFLESLKEKFIRNSTDTDFGIESTIQDFEGFEYKELPVFYVKKSEDTSEEDISMDIVSTLTAYASMAYDNDEMMSIIDVLETTRSLARSANKPISQVGFKDEIDPSTGKPKRKESSNIIERMNTFYDMRIYKESKKDEGTIAGTKIDKGKAADQLMRWSSAVTMSFNLLANVSNIATGRVQILMEAIGGQFYGYKDMKYADALLAKHLGDFVQDLTKKTKSSWLYTVCETFNSMQDYDQDIAHKDFDKKWFQRLSLNGISMFLQQAGEFNMQNTTFFALLHSDKEALKDSSGNKVRVIDSFTVEPIDKNHPDRGSEVVFKKGLIDKNGNKIITKQELKERAKESGVAFTNSSLIKEGEISEIDFINYISRKSAGINQYLHGIYNEEDKAKMYSTGFGRLIGQYRKWIKPSINRRFASTAYNYDLDSYTEGSYRTLFRFIGETLRELKSQEFNIVSRWKEMSDYEKANIRKVLTELSTYVAILIAISLIPDDDDDSWFKNSYAGRMLTYQLYRLKNEVGVMIPGTSMVKEGIKILNSPMAGMNIIEKTSEALSSLMPWDWTEIQSGRYKGWYKPFNTIADLVPYNRAIYRSMNPELGIHYFK